jgi:hypothetical protein
MTFNILNLRQPILWALVALSGMTFQSCSSDDDFPTVDGQAPTIVLTTDQIHAEPGRSFNITGTVKDADGIKSIRLKNEGMLLDKTINLLEIYGDSLLHEYNLDYAYTPANDWTDESNFPLEVTVEDVVGNTTSATLTVKGDGDFTFPTFTSAPSSELTVLLQNPKLTLNASVSDNKKLQSIVVDIPGLNIKDSVLLNGVKEYTLKKQYDVPAKEASYMMTLRVYDGMKNMTYTTSKINVSELPDFDKMYLADVSDAASLTSDLYGVPMLIEHTGKYQYKAHYYNQKVGTGIRFIPQMTDFNPICFGIDENTGLLTSNPSEAKEIILDEVGYYEITFNTITGDYDVKRYTPTTAKMTLNGTTTVNFNDGSGDQPAQICLAGSGLPGTPDWTTNQNNDAFILNQSKTNPYLLYREFNLKAGDEISFTISQTHWWGWWPEPYWRFDGSANNEKNVKNGGENMNSVKAPVTGTYRFEFDYALLRSRIVLVKAK